MLDLFPKNAIIAEVGVMHGHFSKEIINRCNPKELHLIDVTFSTLDECVRRNKCVTLCQSLSVEAMAKYREDFFDVIYIDADHTYAAVKNDITAAVTKLKVGGLIVFNDFGRIVRPGFGVFGVHQAVCEFIVEHKWPVLYFCFQGEALYDIALQKPK